MENPAETPGCPVSVCFFGLNLFAVSHMSRRPLLLKHSGAETVSYTVIVFTFVSNPPELRLIHTVRHVCTRMGRCLSGNVEVFVATA